MNFYGTRYKEVLALIQKEPGLKEPICTCSPAVRAQVVYAIKSEMACREEDIMSRRLSLIYRDCSQKKCLTEIRDLLNLRG